MRAAAGGNNIKGIVEKEMEDKGTVGIVSGVWLHRGDAPFRWLMIGGIENSVRRADSKGSKFDQCEIINYEELLSACKFARGG